MIYSFSITTPANTPESSRKKTEVFLTKGIIHQVDFVFPRGSAGLLYLALASGLHQLWPTNPEEYFHTDGETISFKEFYEVKEKPMALQIYTYNLDDAYEHTVVVRIGLLKRGQIQGVWLPWSEEVITE